MGVMRKALCAAVLGALALPGAASAAETTSDVSGTIGSELSLSASAPAAMVMTRAAAGTATSELTVSSTQPLWTLSIRDASATTPGHMDRVTGTGPASLANPLQWSLSGSGQYYNLSGTPATVKTGALVETMNLDFRQTLGATEGVAAADTYKLTATYTVT